MSTVRKTQPVKWLSNVKMIMVLMINKEKGNLICKIVYLPPLSSPVVIASCIFTEHNLSPALSLCDSRLANPVTQA